MTNEKCKAMLMDLLRSRRAGSAPWPTAKRSSLGGKTLEFIFAPWVHWPETMLTYVREDKVLFSAAISWAPIWPRAGRCSATRTMPMRSAKRYFAEIMMPFRLQIRKHLQR